MLLKRKLWRPAPKSCWTRGSGWSWRQTVWMAAWLPWWLTPAGPPVNHHPTAVWDTTWSRTGEVHTEVSAAQWWKIFECTFFSEYFFSYLWAVVRIPLNILCRCRETDWERPTTSPSTCSSSLGALVTFTCTVNSSCVSKRTTTVPRYTSLWKTPHMCTHVTSCSSLLIPLKSSWTNRCVRQLPSFHKISLKFCAAVIKCSWTRTICPADGAATPTFSTESKYSNIYKYSYFVLQK